MTGTLYHIKLSNGEELITELMPSSNGEEYKLKNPLVIQDVLDSKSGVTAIVLLDYAPFNTGKNSIFLHKNQVISKSIVDNEMVDYYKASLEYSILYGNKDTIEKLALASTNLTDYTQSRLVRDLQFPTERVTPESDLEYEDQDYTDEEVENDIEYFESLRVSSNTTIH